MERITTEIKSSILAGNLLAGEQFSIGELAAEMGVSHIPVREALRGLEADGLVTLRPGRRAIVTPLSIEELTEVYRLRLLIEVDLAGRAARNYTDEQLNEARRACEAFAAADPQGQHRPDLDSHHRLHQMLIASAAGPHSLRITERLMGICDRYICLGFEGRPVQFDAARQRHLELLDAAESRSAPTVRDALSTHLSENLSCLQEWLTPHLESERPAHDTSKP